MEDKLNEGVLLQNILEAAMEGILVLDEQGTVLKSNTVCEQMFGYQEGELVNKNIEFLIPEEFGKIYKNLRKKYSNNSKTRTAVKRMDLQGLKKDGVIFFLNISSIMSPIDGRTVAIIFLRDNTTHKETELEQKTKKDRNEAMLRALPDLMFVLNKQGVCLDVHAPDPSRLLRPKEELLGKCIYDVIPKELHKQFRDAFQKSDKLSTSVNFEYSLSIKNELKISEARMVAKKNGNYLILIRDITERKLVMDELQASETRNKVIVQALPDMVSVHDKNGTVLELLSTVPWLHTQPMEDIIGTKVRDVFPHKLGEHIVKTFAKADRSKTIQILEINLPLVDRSTDFEVRIVPLEKGKLLALSRDVTQKRAIQNILNIRNGALEAAGNSILIADAKLPDLPVVYFNDAFYKMTGYSEGEVLGKNCRFLQNGDRGQVAIDILRTAIKKGEPCQVTLRNYKKDGTLFWNEIALTPLHNDQGVLTHFIGVLNDVTQRKKEARLKDEIRKILELIIEHKPLPIIGLEITEAISGQIDGCMASILLLDKEKHKLHVLAASNLSEGFIQGLEGMSIDPKMCSYSNAAFLKEEVVNEDIANKDIANDPLWEDYKELALRHSIRSCSSFPILSSDMKFLGTCAVYREYPGKLQEVDRKIMMDMVQLAGVAIEQHYVRLILRENMEQLEGYSQKLEQKVKDRTKQVEGTVQKLVEINQDLENQMQTTMVAEKKARASRALFVAVAKNFPNGIIMIYNVDMELIAVEGEDLQKFDIIKNDYLGKKVEALNVFSKERKKALKEQVRRTLDGEQFSFEAEFRKNMYSVNTSPLYVDKNIEWALFVYDNVTEHRRADEEIRKALDKEKKLNEMKSRFIATASHEFRTPLSIILSSANLIGRHNSPAKEEKREKYVDWIKTNVRHLVVILNDFLSLDRLEAGKELLKPEHFDLVQFSKDLFGEMRNTKKKGQKIVLDGSDPTIPVFLDPKMLHYIIVNLLTNAIKYSGEYKDIHVTISRKEDMLAINVKDQGIGIAQDEQEHLFELFFRGKNAVNIQGTGLGLPIVKQYVSIMKGTICFESELGKGSTFFVELPLGQEGKRKLELGN